jgi:uncharacterized protein YbjT (DUF2867 family)
MILASGASGNVGAELIRQLANGGVRALTRDASRVTAPEVVEGDLARPEERLFKGLRRPS